MVMFANSAIKISSSTESQKLGEITAPAKMFHRLSSVQDAGQPGSSKSDSKL